MEEMYPSMLEDGVIARNGAVKLVKPLQAARIPPTVQGVLAARIDRLPADAKQLLQTLSVIGREFPLSLIRAVLTRPDDELSRMLNDLQLGEFIYEQPAPATPSLSSSTPSPRRSRITRCLLNVESCSTRVSVQQSRPYARPESRTTSQILHIITRAVPTRRRP
jgi:hypothetical protein